jgi:DNA polymerase-3 subunit alpha
MSDQKFVHLHCHTDGSLLDGGSNLDKLIRRAQDLQMPALAVTDHGVLYNAWELYEKATKAGITPILGMEAYVAPGDRRDRKLRSPGGKPYYHLVLLAQNLTGYKNLIKLSSRGFTEGYYYHPRLDREMLAQHSEGLVVTSACLAGEVAQHFEAGNEDGAREAAEWYANVFKDRYYLEVQAHDSPGQAALNHNIFRLSENLGVPVVATNDAHFLTADDHGAHDTLVCIGMRKDRGDASRLIYDKGLYFKSAEEMAERFRDRPDTLENTLKIADQTKLIFEKKYYVPSFPMPADERQALAAIVANKGGPTALLSAKTATDVSLSADDLEQRAIEIQLLRDLTYVGAAKRYGTPLPANVTERIEYELGVISNAGYAGYHLIVQDFINEARARNIPVGPGRGSAAGSAVCYSLGITDVEPMKFDLLFERFLNPERVSMPDIDVDFCFERRGEVIDYVREKYGNNAVCQIVTFGTLKARAAVKDVGRVLGFTPQETNTLAAMIPNAPNNSLTIAEAIERVPDVSEKYNTDPRYTELLDLASRIEGLRRHASVHAAGVVIAPGPVEDYVPVSIQKEEGAGAEGATEILVTQYDMNCLEHAGMLKMDFLGLKTLTVINDAVGSVKRVRQESIDLAAIPYDNERTFEMIRAGRTGGIFQMESSLATDKLMAMRASTFDDLVAASALLRPGPLDSGMTDEYIKRKRGEKPVVYPHPLLEESTKDTQGIITYQEQIMRAAQILAGYSLAQADMLRKAVGKKDADLIKQELAKFVTEAVRLGTCTQAKAEELAGLIETFGRYGFNKSHSVAYGVLTYQTAYLKANYTPEFMAALLSSEIGDTDKVVQYLGECKALGVSVLPPDVHESNAKFTVVPAQGGSVVRFGLSAIRGVGDGVVHSIVTAREADGPFADFFDFVTRVSVAGRLNRGVLEALIGAGACDSLGANRSQMLAVADQAIKEATRTRKEESLGQISLFGLPEMASSTVSSTMALPKLEELPLMDKLAREKQVLGLYLSGHPLDELAEVAKTLSSHPSTQLSASFVPGNIRIAGVVTQVTEATAKKSGKKYAKLVVEDLHGPISVVCFPDQWERFGFVLAPGSLVVVQGSYDERDRDADKRDLKLERAENLIDAMATSNVAVTIRLDERAGKDQTSLDRVKTILEAHQGNATVYLEYVTDGAPAARKTARAKVRPSPDLIMELRTVLGPDSINVARSADDASGGGGQGRQSASRRGGAAVRSRA